MSAVNEINGHSTHTNIITEVHITARNPRPPRHQHSGENDGNSSPVFSNKPKNEIKKWVTYRHWGIVREGLRCQARRLWWPWFDNFLVLDRMAWFAQKCVSLIFALFSYPFNDLKMKKKIVVRRSGSGRYRGEKKTNDSSLEEYSIIANNWLKNYNSRLSLSKPPNSLFARVGTSI